MGLRKGGNETIWNIIVPIKVRIHFWRTRLDRLATLVNLSDKGVVTGSMLCPLCRQQPENGDHLFARRDKMLEVRKAVNCWWDVIPESCAGIQGLCGDHRHSKKMNTFELIKDAVMQAYCWAVWKCRNEVVFNCKSFNPLVVANDIQSVVYSWFCYRIFKGKNYSW